MIRPHLNATRWTRSIDSEPGRFWIQDRCYAFPSHLSNIRINQISLVRSKLRILSRGIWAEGSGAPEPELPANYRSEQRCHGVRCSPGPPGGGRGLAGPECCCINLTRKLMNLAVGYSNYRFKGLPRQPISAFRSLLPDPREMAVSDERVRKS